MNPAVSFAHVTFSYPGSPPALVDVSLDIPESAFALVCGATGSGKSTFIRAINGLVPHFSGGAFSGRVLVEGRDTTETAPRDLADVVAFVAQEPDAAFVLDRVEDEIAYLLENLGVERTVMRRRVEEVLDLLNIAGLRDRSVRSLSGGERQRVAIAAALGARPRVLLLDEPTSQLDPQGAEDVLAALQRLVHDLGMTVVLAEHRLERVAGFVDVAVACCGNGDMLLDTPASAVARVGSAPPVTRLGRLLGWDPPPLTVRDARRRASAGWAGPDPRASAIGTVPRSPRPASGGVVLEARGIVAGYGRTEVLREVELSLRSGEVIALMGRNGAGKTTLLRCLCGLHAPARGSVTISGEPAVPGCNVTLCPQAPETVLFKDSVTDEVSATLDAHGSGEDPQELVRRFGLTRLARRHPRDLSAGQRLLVATAATAATDAAVLLLDEPTRGLDPESKLALVAFLRSWAAQGRCAVVATHDVELVAELDTRVVMLASGEVIADGGVGATLGDSPVFSPQMSRVFGPGWLTPEQVAGALR